MDRESFLKNLDSTWEMLFPDWDVKSVTFEGEVIIDNRKYLSVTYYPKNYDNPSFVRLNP